MTTDDSNKGTTLDPPLPPSTSAPSISEAPPSDPSAKPKDSFGPQSPAPWTLRGDSYWFFPPPTLSPWASWDLPAGTLDPLQASRPVQGKFVGGLASLQLLRYKVSPVGPYDELLLVPGEFRIPEKGGKWSALRVTRIYVSTLESVVNGRRNWNIPKHLARFTFDSVDPSDQDGSMRVSVFACTSTSITSLSSDLTYASEPFFSAVLSPSKKMPSFPLQTRFLPLDFTLVQPPLAGYRSVEGDEHDEMVGTSEWKVIKPEFRGKCEVVWGRGGLKSGKWGDGEGFPDLRPFSMGLVWKYATIGFPEGKTSHE